MEMAITLASVGCLALAIAGFVYLYQPSSVRQANIARLKRGGKAQRAEDVSAKPLWRLRLVGAALILAAFLAVQVVLWALADMTGQRFSVGTALVEGVVGIFAFLGGLAVVFQPRAQLEPISPAGIPIWWTRIIGLFAVIWGGVLVADAITIFWR